MRRRTSKGLLVVLSAPSGCGKTTIIQELLSRSPNLTRSVSATTRRPRREEVDGRDYFFLSRTEFLKRKKSREFLEWARVFGHYYGTPKQETVRRLRRGRDVVLTIDVQGARQVRRKMKGVFIFVMPPSMQDLEKRLLSRQRDPRREIEKRLRRARMEMGCAKEYDYVVTNRYVGATLRAIEEILAREKKARRKSRRGILVHQGAR